jgi:hypothetical protein
VRARELEHLLGMAVDAARGLEDADLLDRDHLIEASGKARGAEDAVEHGRAAIGENGEAQAAALQVDEGRLGILERVEPQIELHQPPMQLAVIEPEQLHGVVEGIGGDLPEIGMDPHQASQPGILQLLVAPGGG